MMTLQQLEDIELRLTLAETPEDVAGAVLQLVSHLRKEAIYERPASPAEQALRQLVREAFDHINDPDSKIDLRDWTREAKKWL